MTHLNAVGRYFVLPLSVAMVCLLVGHADAATYKVGATQTYQIAGSPGSAAQTMPYFLARPRLCFCQVSPPSRLKDAPPPLPHAS